MSTEPGMNTTVFYDSESENRIASSEAGTAPGNSTHSEVTYYFPSDLTEKVIWFMIVIISLLGLVGNGTVIWLLGFLVKRNPFSVYILNLACDDFTSLLGVSTFSSYLLLPWCTPKLASLIVSVYASSFLVGASLLMALSTECCVSVLCPIRYRCHRPHHLSSILCAVVWSLNSALGIWEVLCILSFKILCINMISVRNVVAFITFLVLCVTGLTLLMQVECSSRRRQSSRLYVTIMLNVTTFLLLGLPLNLWFIVKGFSLLILKHDVLLLITQLLLALNSMVNPIIYFFVGRLRKQWHQKTLQEVLQRALADQEEGSEQERKATVPSQDILSS